MRQVRMRRRAAARAGSESPPVAEQDRRPAARLPSAASTAAAQDELVARIEALLAHPR